ncbi:MAG: type IVB secretion system protein IcmF [Legionella sp.]
MDKSLRLLCEGLTKVVWQLKPQVNPLSFIILTGKDKQGKTALLRQSQFIQAETDLECYANIFYNQQGIIVELGESWINQSQSILQHTLKKLNNCHRKLKITGIMLCIDINEFLDAEPQDFNKNIKTHSHLLRRFGESLGYKTKIAIICTKTDALAGFCDFFQYEHTSELNKPLGFSLYHLTDQKKIIDTYQMQFERLVDVLSNQIISKIHPARSTLKRTLIREFPVQIASLQFAIQSFIQQIPSNLFFLEAIYFTSAEQGGMSHDQLNKKIKHEYELVVQDKFPQANNYRSFFIEGALIGFQTQTMHHVPKLFGLPKSITTAIAIAISMIVTWLVNQHLTSSHLLDEASKELLLYETQQRAQTNKSPAIYHLSKAANSIERISFNLVSLPALEDLKIKLKVETDHHLRGDFLPEVLHQIEQSMTDTRETQAQRYQALKVYLMLAEPKHFSENIVFSWFREHNQHLSKENLSKKLILLQQVLKQPIQPAPINQQLVSDIRNYLNALPTNYLYYSLAKTYLSDQKQLLNIGGFELGETQVPIYLTKNKFNEVLSKLPKISQLLENERWVLERENIHDLSSLLQQAYIYEYVHWWKNFIQRSTPVHVIDFQQAKQLTQAIRQSNSIKKLIHIIQEETSPQYAKKSTIFNEEIASKFTEINLLSRSSINQLTDNLLDLEKFITTLSLVNDQGKTAFLLSKNRFQGDRGANPLGELYTQMHQLPEPISVWIKKITDDTWSILLSQCKHYINEQWQESVFDFFQHKIARHYPFDLTEPQDVNLTDFNSFFSHQGILNNFIEFYIKPFLDTSQPQWQLKEIDNYVLPISTDVINQLIRANIITNMFFTEHDGQSKVEFSLQKLSLDPVVANLQLILGDNKLYDDQNTDRSNHFIWPQLDAKLTINAIDGNHFDIEEKGPWAFFKLLQKVNVLVDEHDSSSLQILFEINGNSGRYLLKTENQINPFVPGILNGFSLSSKIA